MLATKGCAKERAFQIEEIAGEVFGEQRVSKEMFMGMFLSRERWVYLRKRDTDHSQITRLSLCGLIFLSDTQCPVAPGEAAISEVSE